MILRDVLNGPPRNRYTAVDCGHCAELIVFIEATERLQALFFIV